MKDYYVQLYANILDNLQNIDNSLEAYNLPRLNHQEIENLSRKITTKVIEIVIKNLPQNKNPKPDCFTVEFYQKFKELIPIFLKLFQEIEEEGTFPNSFYEASIP